MAFWKGLASQIVRIVGAGQLVSTSAFQVFTKLCFDNAVPTALCSMFDLQLEAEPLKKRSQVELGNERPARERENSFQHFKFYASHQTAEE
jgi:hypothetical protein